MVGNGSQLVGIVNHSTVVTAAEVPPVVQALQTQVTRDFQPHWNAGAALLLVDATPAGPAARLTAPDLVRALPPGAWVLTIADDSDQAGALGYHEIDQSTTPIGFVFAKSDLEDGLSWTVTASHELLEMLGDPFANQAVQIGEDGTAVAYESADAVEDDQFAYDIDGVKVSDFVLPRWFVDKSTGPWDFGGHCTAPFQILDGGYMPVFKPGQGWTQVTAGSARHEAGPRFRLRRDGFALPQGYRSWPKPDWLGDPVGA
jgi:hypothetical protein